ncbi:MAG: SDR family NAD(P)-dependent oxidoreductase [Corallococcus sp.]|nr:SDR family NAD(P)-dependent oxidoreductase [Bacillota bacterium]MCM1533219.1 SDR family NAD(P)-dependent oxidoreductase [Corallococcus sp.]
MKIALVTGASSGMGKEFALKLDEFGLDEIWGVALDQSGLDETGKLMKTPFRTFAVDLTKDGVDVVRQTVEAEKPDIRWLVNASGFGKFGRYDEIPVEQSTNMVRLNCEVLVAITEYCLPYMTSGAKIAQFSSVAAFQPTPFQNVYAATKAFVHSYARALNVELRPRKIKVCAVCPFWTKTDFFDRAETTDHKVVINYAAMYDPKDVVKRAYKDIMKGKDISICGFIARSQVRMVRIVPTTAVMNTWVKQQKFDKRYK